MPDGVERQREEGEELEGDEVGGECGLSEARGHRAGQRERGVERGRAHEDVPPDAHQGAHVDEAGAAVVGGRAQQEHDEGRTHSRLGEDRPPGGAGEPELQPVDEPDLEHDVRRVAGDHHDERCAQVAHAAQVALTRQRHEAEDGPERRYAQEGDRQRGGLALAPHEGHERRGQHQEGCADARSDAEREPQRLGREPPGRRRLAGSMQARNLRSWRR